MSSANTTARPWLLPPPIVYPQREEQSPSWLEPAESAITGISRRVLNRHHKARYSRIVSSVNEAGAAYAGIDKKRIRDESDALRLQLCRRGFQTGLVVRSFALIREAAAQTIGLRHYDVQLIAGFALLNGMIAEMETGEGKTLAATLAAGTAALSGVPVHIVTVNDYLAQRDTKAMGPVFRALGLHVGLVVHGTEHNERASAYSCDITYCSNKEIAFDYLRDRINLGNEAGNIRLKLERMTGKSNRSNRLVMRGLHYAIVDEADSVLIDEARTPLIISQETSAADECKWAQEAMKLGGSLLLNEDYRILKDERRVELTETGRERLAKMGEELGGIWRGRIRREEATWQALTANHLFHRGDHYLVRDGRVQIVDEYTGRIMADRSWNDGLHQLIETKEGCKVTGRKFPLARISYQSFFRRYRRLAGMTATAREVATELWAVYRLPVMCISTNRPLHRRRLGEVICLKKEQKWQQIVDRAKELHKQGRPVLIGTRSVATSETVSRWLSQADLEHVVLNADQDRDEAEIIARAGESRRITVATNMAGRGVDIRLAKDVLNRGGLHVILSERHDSGRIDRQLAGRCGRQGEPGSYEAILSLDDPLLEVVGLKLLRRAASLRGALRRIFAGLLFRIAQRKAERVHSRMRRDLLKLDQQMGTLLAFAGERE